MTVIRQGVADLDPKAVVDDIDEPVVSRRW